jgi:hypothetical protein
LFNYDAKRFNITDVIGDFDKDPNGDIILQRDKVGQYVDKKGRRVNEKGYLLDKKGNVIDNQGKVIFERKHLKDGEIPKIFPFSKFNVGDIKGDCKINENGDPIM